MSGHTRAGRLWLSVSLWPLGVAVAYYVCLRTVAPQDSYCERTAQTFPWHAGAGLNVWGGIGLGLVAAAGLGVGRAALRSTAPGWGRALSILIALVLAAVLVTFAYLVPWIHYSCGE